MSDNLRMLGAYSAAMESGDGTAVFEFWSDDFVSHVTERVSPDRVGTDVRGQEQEWWQQAKSAFPDMQFLVNLLIEQDDLVVSNWTVKGTHTGTAFYDVPAVGRAGRDQRHRGAAHPRRQDRRALGRSALPAGPRPHPLSPGRALRAGRPISAGAGRSMVNGASSLIRPVLRPGEASVGDLFDRAAASACAPSDPRRSSRARRCSRVVR